MALAALIPIALRYVALLAVIGVVWMWISGRWRDIPVPSWVVWISPDGFVKELSPVWAQRFPEFAERIKRYTGLHVIQLFYQLLSDMIRAGEVPFIPEAVRPLVAEPEVVAAVRGEIPVDVRRRIAEEYNVPEWVVEALPKPPTPPPEEKKPKEIPGPPPVITDPAEFIRESIARGLSLLEENIKEFIKGLKLPDVTEITTKIEDVVKDVTQNLTKSLEKVVEGLKPIVNVTVQPIIRVTEDIARVLKDVSQDILRKVEEFTQPIVQEIQKITTAVSEKIQTIINTIIEQLSKVIADIEVGISRAIEPITKTITDLLSDLVSSRQRVIDLLEQIIAKPEDITKPISDPLKEIEKTLTKFDPAKIGTEIGTGIGQLTGDAEERDTETPSLAFFGDCRDLLEGGLGALLLPVLAGAAMRGRAGLLNVLGKIFDIGILVGMIIELFKVGYKPAFTKAEYDAYERCPTREPTISDLLDMLFKGVISEEEYQHLAQRNGYRTELVQKYYEAERNFVTADQRIRAGLRRREVNPSTGELSEDIRNYLRMQRYRDEEIDTFKELAYYIPPISDLIRMAVRDVFTPATVSAYGLKEDFPEAVVEWGEKQGISREWLEAYWAAHWDLPSVQQVFEMLHRRVISLDEVRTFLKVADISPPWRDKLIEISYRPLTRIDARRAFMIDAIDEQTLKNAYLDLGYNEQNADILVRFNKIEKARQKLTLTSEQDRAIASAVAKAYEKYLVDRSVYVSTLKSMNLDDDIITTSLSRSELERKINLLDKVEDVVRRGYVMGLMDSNEVARILKGYGMPDEGVSVRLSLWNIERELREEKAELKADRDLTVRDVIVAFESDVVTEEYARNYLKNLGYDDTEVGILIANAKFRKTRQKITTAVNTTRDAYIEGLLTREEAVQRLASVGIGSEQIERLMSDWVLRYQTRIVSRLTELVRTGRVALEEVKSRLATLGLAADDIERVYNTIEREVLVLGGAVA